MHLEGIMLSEKNQTKTNTVWTHLYVESEKNELTETENNRLVVDRDGGRNGWRGSKGKNFQL